MLVVGFALGVVFVGAPIAVRAGGGQGGVVECTAKNGDVNGDGLVQLSDAVTILSYLFLGNPTKLVGLCAPTSPSGLPDSGQTTCYAENGSEIPCDSVTCLRQDGFYATGCSPEGRFIDNDDGTVTDNCTGLMWQKDTGNDGNALPWCAALAYCDNLSLGGGLVAWDDWRLPNVRELQSIVDYGRFKPSIDPVFDALPSFYWSSTSNAGFPDVTWLVQFGYGSIIYDDKDVNNGHVRAVRGGP